MGCVNLGCAIDFPEPGSLINNDVFPRSYNGCRGFSRLCPSLCSPKSPKVAKVASLRLTWRFWRSAGQCGWPREWRHRSTEFQVPFQEGRSRNFCPTLLATEFSLVTKTKAQELTPHLNSSRHPSSLSRTGENHQRGSPARVPGHVLTPITCAFFDKT